MAASGGTDMHKMTRIVVAGSEIADRIDALVPAGARVLLLYDEASTRRNGALEQVHVALHARVVYEFGRVQAGPDHASLRGALGMIRSEKLDFVLAVGGSPLIEGTRIVAAAIAPDDDAWRILTSMADIHREPIWTTHDTTPFPPA